ncbi:uncharacterized protein CPUR_08648 [Claviceps purpurea 20.1]|uniref:Uncharacterized protein n=1 Tax=Claviceps purpurea (strain 20.1) TaxID=1111077 RepID=M1VZ83_CLAP2|nr:uncharacterized protein CPUR_08648 [Claviceps purpurea 20.1]
MDAGRKGDISGFSQWEDRRVEEERFGSQD